LKSLRAFALTLLITVVLPTGAEAQSPSTGGAAFAPAPTEPSHIVVAGSVAQLLPDGSAAAPADAPIPVQNAIFAANRLNGKPYVYGGGHGRWEDKGYDCSGTVSYALHGADLLATPLASGGFMRWGEKGPGQWISVFANGGHAYAVIAGLRLDTSSYGSSARTGRRVAKTAFERGPRWRPTQRPSTGFRVRHPLGF
jgi:hypothetical protein